jgi:hypothetical protein
MKKGDKMAQETQRRIPLEETRKRQTALTVSRGTVMIIIPRMQLVGIPQVAVNRKEKDQKIVQEVAQRGLATDAYREKPDTGFCVVNGVPEVSLDTIITQLIAIGLFFSGGRVETWTQENGSFACKTVLEFSADLSRKQEMPQSIRDTLAHHVFKIYVWANWKFRDEEKGRSGGQYRLDTINCAEKRILGSGQKPLRHLNVKRNTYDVQEG